MATKITRLTKSQIGKFDEYVERWKQIGLCTKPANRVSAEEGIKLIYKEAKLDSPKIVWMNSPFKAKNVDGIRKSVRDNLENLAHKYITQGTSAIVRDLLWRQIWEPVEQTIAPVAAPIKQDWHRRQALGYGQFDASWLGMYEYCQEILQFKGIARLQGHMMIARSAGWYLPDNDTCWISERPTVIQLDNRGRLHCENKEAFGYPDGWKYYALHGVPMKPEYVLTPSEQIPLKTILNEENVDVKAQLIRKIGLVRLLDIGKIIEDGNYYKLVDMSPLLSVENSWGRSGSQYAPHLLMLNPSVPDLWHLEGVDIECTTIEQAHNYRYKRVFEKKVISPDGENWYQQGDVLIYPEDAIALKPFPVVIT